MAIRQSLLEALEALDKDPASDEVRLWLERLETLLDWIVQQPKLVEIRYEAARLLSDYRGADVFHPPARLEVPSEHPRR